MNISSIVIKVRPEKMDEVLKSLVVKGLCEVHFTDERGRIVASLEGDSGEDEAAKLREITKMPNIVSACFAYCYSDNESN